MQTDNSHWLLGVGAVGLLVLSIAGVAKLFSAPESELVSAQGRLDILNGLPSPQPLEEVLPAPSRPFVQFVTDRSVTLGFVDNSNNETNFIIEKFLPGSFDCRLPNRPDPAFTPRIVGASFLAAPRTVFHEITLLEPNTTYDFCVRAVSPGNASPYAPMITVTTLAQPLSGRTTVRGNPDVGVEGSRATIRWITSRPTTSQLDYSVNRDLSGYGSTPEFDAPPNARTILHQVVLDNLVPGRRYYVRAYGTDESGQKVVAPTINFLVEDRAMPPLPSGFVPPSTVLPSNVVKINPIPLPERLRLRYGLSAEGDDTDGDGFPDIVEILNNFSPTDPRPIKQYAFGLPRLVDTSPEDEARKLLHPLMKTTFQKENIEFYVRAIVYGGYPLADAVALSQEKILTNRPFGL